jgi:hypothetical protein
MTHKAKENFEEVRIDRLLKAEFEEIGPRRT